MSISWFLHNIVCNILLVDLLDLLGLHICQKVLQQDGDNNYAKVHLGYILKAFYKEYDLSIKYFTEGLAASIDRNVNDALFYVHLGDALVRTGRKDEVGYLLSTFSFIMCKNWYFIIF